MGLGANFFALPGPSGTFLASLPKPASAGELYVASGTYPRAELEMTSRGSGFGLQADLDRLICAGFGLRALQQALLVGYHSRVETRVTLSERGVPAGPSGDKSPRYVEFAP